MNKSEITKSLKRFLKKKASYSLALLVGFLITGTISLGAVKPTLEINGIKRNLLIKVKQERERIKEKIKENEKKISKEMAISDVLINELDFYGKPLWQNIQGFFTYNKINSGLQEDNTKEAWKETIDAGIASGLSPETALDTIFQNSGMIVNEETYRETIEISANYVPLVPDIPVINKDINIIIPLPGIGTIGLPNIPKLEVASVDIVGITTVGPVTAPLITPPNITAPDDVTSIVVAGRDSPELYIPDEKEVNIGTPVLPSGFKPNQLMPPVLPNIPEFMDGFIDEVFIGGDSLSHSPITDASYFWATSGRNGLISQAKITGGDFTFTIDGDKEDGPFTAAVKDYAATEAFGYGDTVYGGTGVENANVPAGKKGMYTMVGSRYSSFGENTQIRINSTFTSTNYNDRRRFIIFDPNGEKAAASIDDITEASDGEKTKAKELVEKYKGEVPNFNDEGYQILALNGQLTIAGNGVVGVHLQENAKSNPIILHAGVTKIEGNRNIVFGQTYFANGGNNLSTITNYETGVILINGDGNVVMAKPRINNAFIFENSGKIEIQSGDTNVGLSMIGPNTIYLQNPIIISSEGERNKGVTLEDNDDTSTLNGKSVIKVNVTNGKYNYGLVAKSGSSKLEKIEINVSGGERNTGIYLEGSTTDLGDTAINISGGSANVGMYHGGSHKTAFTGDITIGKNTTKAIGIIQVGGKVSQSAGEIRLEGNEGLGILAHGSGTTTEVDTIRIIGGKENMAATSHLYSNNTDITVKKLIVTDTTDSILLIASGKISVNDLDISISVDSKDTGVAIARENSLITIGDGGISKVTGGTSADGVQLGFGLIAIEGGKIVAKGNTIEVINGSTGIFSSGKGLDPAQTPSHIDFTGGTLKYTGNSYAIHTVDGGEVDLSGAIIELAGKSSAYEIDFSETSTITIDTDTKIKVLSNDVIVFNLKKVGTLSTDSLKQYIDTKIGASTDDLIVQGTVDGKLITEYKIAAANGGAITVGNLDRTGTDVDNGDGTAKDYGNFYYNRFLGQRLVATTVAGSTISAVLDNTEAGKYNDQVVGFEMNSSNLAVNNAEAGIHLVGSTVIADRTDAGTGAMGLFINYGTVTVDGTSKILVEKSENDNINSNGVGIYSVNGSDVTVATGGTIDVAGAGAIGILGMAYREDAAGTPIGNGKEFGAAALGQGEVSIENSGTITLDGLGSIGIYAVNNNDNATATDSIITNNTTGIITVGKSGEIGLKEVTSVGMYGSKSTISNVGTITVGDGGVGIYGVEGSEITSLGTINLASDGVGVMVDGTSSITATSTLTLGGANGIGVIFKDKTVPVMTTFDIDASSMTNGIGIYAENSIMDSVKKLKIGTNGIGIYSKNSTVTNNGTIDLGVYLKAVGMYLQTETGKTGSITNAVTINIGEESQFAMVGTGVGSTIENTGTINLNVANSTGIYGSNGATINLSGNGIKFGTPTTTTTDSIGAYIEKAIVNITGALTHTSNNADKNILIYGKAGSTINNTAGMTVNGNGVVPGNPNKTIGIYLDGTITNDDGTISNVKNNYIGTASLDVTGGAIGLYSFTDNTLTFTGGLNAEGSGTIGAYVDGKATVTGDITSDHGAIGVYGKSGVITLNPDAATKITVGATSGSLLVSTGFYLEGGASLTGNLDIKGGNNGIGVYYSGGTSPVINAGTMAITKIGAGADNLVGVYVGGNATLNNNGAITGTGNNVIATMAKDGTLNIGGAVTVSGKDSVGAYASDGGTITNNSTITATNTSAPAADITIGMLASSGAGTATVVNAGMIISDGAKDVGMYLGDTVGNNVGENSSTGTINVTNGIAAYINGANNTFDNAGTINVAGKGTGIYLKGTGTGKITSAGTINLGLAGSQGIYAENSVVDFDVTTAGAAGGIGVYATGTITKVTGTITVADGQIGIYAENNNVDLTGAIVKAKNNVGTGTNTISSVGIYLKDNANLYTMTGTNVTVENGIGVYLGNNGITGTPATPATQGTDLTFAGTVTTTGGTGIYVPDKSVLTTGTATLNVNGGIGVFVAGGIANLGTGTTETLTINLSGDGSRGIYVAAGGTLVLGDKIVVTGTGSLASTINGSLTSSATLNIEKDSQGLLGAYSGTPLDGGPYEITNTGTINITAGGIGLAAKDNYDYPTPSTPSTTTVGVKIENSGELNVIGHTTDSNDKKVDSIGIYSELAEIENLGTDGIKISGDGGIGIYYNGKITIAKDITSNNIELNGSNGIGIFATGNMGAIKNTTITNTDIASNNNTGILLLGAPTLPLTKTVVSNLDVGTINLGKESIGLIAQNIEVATTVGGVITIGNGTEAEVSVGVYLDNSTIGTLSNVSVGEYGVAYSMKNGSEATIDFTNTSIGTNGVYLNAVGSKANISGNLTVATGSTGIYSKDGTLNFTGPSTINVTGGGTGLVVINSNVTATLPGNVPTITVNAGTSSDNYSVGSYYDTVTSSLVLSDISTTTQMGNYTISHVLDKANATIGSIVLGGGAGNNQIGVMLKTGSTLTAGTVGTTIDITGGDNNIGIYASSGTVANNVTVHGNINVGNSSSLDNSSIGVYVKNGTYTGNSGKLTVGNNSIGVYGEKLTGPLSQGAITAGNSALGIYAQSDTGTTVSQTGGLQVGNAGSIGIYGSGTNIFVNSTGAPAADKVGTGTSIGILSKGAGNVTYTGTMDITASADSGSIGIYKDGTGTITVGSSILGSTDNLTVGAAGYGIYSINGEDGDNAHNNLSSTVINNADMTLGKASIGIYSRGKGTVDNYGNITVGESIINTDDPTKTVNSIGIYSSGGKIVNYSDAIITVGNSHSIGIYADNGATITNDGTINVSKGGIGILAYGIGTSVINNGTINVVGTGNSDWESIGISIDTHATVTNYGDIILSGGGYGINTGENGKIINGIGGTITVVTGSTGIDITGNKNVQVSVGGIIINTDGSVTIGGDYVSVGGKLDATGADINLDGTVVDGTTVTGKPIFTGNTVSGEIDLSPEFISREPVTVIENFFDSFVGVNMSNGVTVIAPPGYVAKKVGNDLYLVRQPYADLSVGDQFYEFEKSLDHLIQNGNDIDSNILTYLEKYLDQFADPKGLDNEEYNKERGKAMAEIRGDIYGTIQGRMQNINSAFDNSFDELVSSYNPSKESDKFSVIVTSGDFKDPTLGVSDYDYDVKGLLYMHEEEGLTYGTKYGYTLGIAGSEFKFDDDNAGSSGSSEDVYSLRVGAHREQKLGKTKFTWLTRGELAYNYHNTDRKMQLGQGVNGQVESFDNEADYSSYGASFKNELSYTAYSTLSTKLKVYGGANLEYGAMVGFSEETGSKGGLELEVKGNDYFVGELEAGLRGSKKIYLGKNLNLNLTADAGYGYDLGDNYPGNEARLKNGGEGYYDLINSEKAEGTLKGKLGIGLEKANHYGITFEAEWNKRDNRTEEDVKYSARFNYKF